MAAIIKRFFNGTSDSLPTFDANMELRLDVSRDFTATFGTNYALSTESAVSDNLSVPAPLTVDGRPFAHRYGAFAEVAKVAGRVQGRLRGTFLRSQFATADLSDGSKLSQGDRNNNLWQATARVGYEVSPAWQPFVEGGLGVRRFDQSVDRNGNRRNSVIGSLRGGVAFDFGEKLNGELGVGYSSEKFDDGGLNAIQGWTLDGQINWSPQRFTTVTATAQTSFNGSTDLNESGSITYAASLGVVRDVRPNLSLNARVLASLRTFQGSSQEDRTLQAEVGAEWRLNRSWAILSRVGYDKVDSTEVGNSYNAFSGNIALRWQR